MSTAELKPSYLGTKEHWDSVYEEELTNFHEIGDEGEVWFGEESVEKMVDWAVQYVPPETKPNILEVGCGNGTLLLALIEAGYDQSRLLGIDYSADAVLLALAVAMNREFNQVAFARCDFLLDTPRRLPHMDPEGPEAWDVLMDKGTYDAIALSEKDEAGKSPADKYPARVVRLLKPGGLFLITSCNFTEDELKANFITPDTGLIYHSRIQYATYIFNGKTGSVCSSIAFQKSAQ